MSAYVHTPAQSRTIAALHELAIQPITYPTGEMRDTADIEHDHAPWLMLHSSGEYVTVNIRNLSPSGSLTVEVCPLGRILDWDPEVNDHVPCVVVWRADERWPAVMWRLKIEHVVETHPAIMPVLP